MSKTTYTCDQCECRYERYASKQNPDFHFCSRACQVTSQKCGSLRARQQRKLDELGVTTTLQLSDVKEKTRLTLEERYGSQSAFVEHVKSKSRETCRELYGVDHIFQRDVVRRAALTAASSAECRAKAHRTMKDRGLYGCLSSNVENDFYRVLCEIFGDDDVVRQLCVNGWRIDFYIKSHDAYVQFDGVYWHGLDRSYESIITSHGQRDRKIVRVIEVDRKQNEWFRESGLTLIRVTDSEFLSSLKSVTERLSTLAATTTRSHTYDEENWIDDGTG